MDDAMDDNETRLLAATYAHDLRHWFRVLPTASAALPPSEGGPLLKLPADTVDDLARKHGEVKNLEATDWHERERPGGSLAGTLVAFTPPIMGLGAGRDYVDGVHAYDAGDYASAVANIGLAGLAVAPGISTAYRGMPSGVGSFGGRLAKAPSRLPSDQLQLDPFVATLPRLPPKPAIVTREPPPASHFGSLERAVDKWSADEAQAAGGKELFPYREYLKHPADQPRLVTETARTETLPEMRAPARGLSPEVKRLTNRHTMGKYRDLASEGLMADADGRPVNPWYWPAARVKSAEGILGRENAADFWNMFHGYNATMSPGTSVTRAAEEAWLASHMERNPAAWRDLGYGSLWELPNSKEGVQGPAHNVKRDLSTQWAKDRNSLPGTEQALKVRNYLMNQQGAGSGPWVFNERSPGTVTIDSIMNREGGLVDRAGNSKERARGPAYYQHALAVGRTGQRVGEESYGGFHAAPADTQAAIWQSAQARKHGLDAYRNPLDRSLADVIIANAREYGITPQEMMERFYSLDPKFPPKMIFADGGSVVSGDTALQRAGRHANAWAGAADYALGNLPSTALALLSGQPVARAHEWSRDASDDFAHLYPFGRDVLGLAESMPTRFGRVMTAGRSPHAKIPGMPDAFHLPSGERVPAAPIPDIVHAAEDYAKSRGVAHIVPERFEPLDQARASRVANAYAAAAHQPHDPATAAAYDRMIEETMAQYRALKDRGYTFSFMKPNGLGGVVDPYAASPALGYKDLRDNKHLQIFPTTQGFGSLEKISENPLLRDSGEMFRGAPATVNDIFRAVHDAYGHFGHGNAFFRAPGEERAWAIHSQMFSPEARQAMTSETRGQNSWVNFGPHGAANRSASGANTVYADQKTTLLPPWVGNEGVPAGVSFSVHPVDAPTPLLTPFSARPVSDEQ